MINSYGLFSIIVGESTHCPTKILLEVEKKKNGKMSALYNPLFGTILMLIHGSILADQFLKYCLKKKNYSIREIWIAVTT